MQDLSTTFKYQGEELGLLWDYKSLHNIEFVHKLIIGDAWEQISKSGAIATCAVLFEGLEGHRRLVTPRIRKWTLGEAEQIYMKIGVARCAKLVQDAFGKVLSPPSEETEDKGKGEGPKVSDAPESTGAPSA